jgi:hypothetical protein
MRRFLGLVMRRGEVITYEAIDRPAGAEPGSDQ